MILHASYRGICSKPAGSSQDHYTRRQLCRQDVADESVCKQKVHQSA